MSDAFLQIEGGAPLKGKVVVQGAKNAALPQLIAALLTGEACTFTNVPELEDVSLVLSLLSSLGAKTERLKDKVTISAPSIKTAEASYSLVRSLRASFWVLAPLLARCGEARIALPGGDIIGARPVDMHLSALSQLGVSISVKQGIVVARAPEGLHPASITLPFPSVGATHQVLMIASLIDGTTVLNGAAREPEVVALSEMLSRMGASFEGVGSSKVTIHGRKTLVGTHSHLIGDRIEAGTFLLAALSSRGKVRVEGIHPNFLETFLEVLRESGAYVATGDDWIEVAWQKSLTCVRVVTGPFPEFPTDLQAPLMALCCTCQGDSTIEETVFEGRFSNVAELGRLGARISVRDRVAVVHGVSQLAAASVDGLDIRAAAALVVAALGAEGESEIHEIHHLRRGYAHFEERLQALGAKLKVCNPATSDFGSVGC
jgi:UDP-N-acetylglucosamine 1-carboxyvinyltransferase